MDPMLTKVIVASTIILIFAILIWGTMRDIKRHVGHRELFDQQFKAANEKEDNG